MPVRELVVPAVHAAHEVVASDAAVGEQGATMLAATVQHRDLVVVADDHEVDVADEGSGRLAVGQVAPASDVVWLHER